MRSGLIEKRQETRDPSQDDVQEAIAIIERAVRKNPNLENPSSSWSHSSLSKRCTKSSVRRSKHHEDPKDDSEVAFSLKKSKSYEEPRKSLKFEDSIDCTDSSTENRLESDVSSKPEISQPINLQETSSKKLKRTNTLQKSLNEFSDTVSNGEKSETKDSVNEQTTSKVKIIVSDENERKIIKDSTLPKDLEKPNEDKKMTDESEQKLTELRRKKLTGLKRFDWNPKNL